MKTALISLVGEQPVPNLLPARWLKPDGVLLIHTDFTERVATNLQHLLEPESHVWLCPVPAYDIVEFQAKVREFLAMNLSGWDLIFNLTGGTKLMALAALGLVQSHRASFVYLQTEGNQSRLYHYVLEDGEFRQYKVEDLQAVITLDDFLMMHLAEYQVVGFARTPEGEFEKAVHDALQAHVDEILAGVKKGGALEIDLVIRCGNQVGIVEVKSGKKARSKEGLDQLNTAGGREFLGIYTQKFLVVGTSWERLSNLKALAEARRVIVIELPGWARLHTLSSKDKERLVENVKKYLNCNST